MTILFFTELDACTDFLRLTTQTRSRIEAICESASALNSILEAEEAFFPLWNLYLLRISPFRLQSLRII